MRRLKNTEIHLFWCDFVNFQTHEIAIFKNKNAMRKYLRTTFHDDLVAYFYRGDWKNYEKKCEYHCHRIAVSNNTIKERKIC